MNECRSGIGNLIHHVTNHQMVASLSRSTKGLTSGWMQKQCIALPETNYPILTIPISSP